MNSTADSAPSEFVTDSTGGRWQVETSQTSTGATCDNTRASCISDTGVMVIPNKRLAVTPITVNIEREVRNGVAIAKQKVALVMAAVVFPDDMGVYSVGDIVYMRGDVIVQPWSKEVYELDGFKFILCPMEQIQAAKKTQKMFVYSGATAERNDNGRYPGLEAAAAKWTKKANIL